MARGTTYFLLAVLLIGFALAGKAELSNPSFERVPFRQWLGPWGGGSQQSRGDGFLVTTGMYEFARTGQRSVRLTVSDPAGSGGMAWCGITQVYPCKTGRRVTACAWVYSTLDYQPVQSGTRAQIKFEFCSDENGNDIISDMDYFGPPYTAGGEMVPDAWTLLEADTIAPEGARAIKLSVVLIADRVAGEPQSVWVDDVSLEVEGIEVDPEARNEPNPDPLTVPEVLLARGTFYRGGERFWLKGVGYSPYRPGFARDPKNPGPRDALREDMKRIKAAGFNTLRTWDDMPDYIYELAAEEGLYVLTGVWAPLGDLTEPALWEYAAEVVREKVGRLRKHPNILGYLILNEPEPALFEEADDESIQAYFNAVITAAHEMDPFRPCSTTPWIIMWFVDNSQWDMLSYNMYKYFPSAVNTNFGYARFVDYTRRVQAEPRPFLITEFGYPVNPTGDGGFAYGGNSLEEQAVGVVSVLEGIVAGGAQGGCVFEWNDEWWKPENTPNDHMTHDDDPEEYFGLIGFESAKDMIGTPRPAYYAIQKFYDNLVLSPRDGTVYTEDIQLCVYQDRPGRIAKYEYWLDGGEWTALAQNGSWCEKKLRHEDLAQGTHELRVRAVANDGTIDEELVRTLSFGIADETQAPDHGLSLQIGPEGRTPADPVEITVTVLSAEGDPVPDYEVRVSLLHTRPLTDTYYQERTDSNGAFSVVFIPPREAPLSHLMIWASCDTTLAGHPTYAGADASIWVEGTSVEDRSIYKINIPKAEKAPVIDGKLDESWGLEPQINFSLPPYGLPAFTIMGRWLGNDDLSAAINLLWDEENLYYLMDVIDESPASNTWSDAELWKGDGVEVYLGTDADARGEEGYAPTDYQFILAPENKTWVYGQASGGTRNEPLKGAEVVTVPTDRGYVLEAKIPWENFSYTPENGDALRMEFVLNDAEEGQGLPTKFLWASQGEAYRISGNWGRAVLSGEPAK